MVGMKRKTTIFDIINIAFLAILCITTIYPFLYLILASFTPAKDMIHVFLLPRPSRFDLSSYKFIFNDNSIANAYSTTIFITVVGTIINLILSTLGAYVLAQRDLPGKGIMVGMLVLTMIFSGGLIPTFIVVKNIGLYNTVWSLVIPNAINTFWMIIMRNFFKEIPSCLPESARIDGLNEFGILLKIIIPLSMPIIATLSLFYGVMHWNEYTNAIIYINNTRIVTLQVLIRSMYQSATSTIAAESLPPPIENVRAATIMVATIPILLVYPFLQKYFVTGIMVGAVKG